MSAGTNVARPSTSIDLETVQRNLREVMTNLRLLENGENVRVEDLIRQARENLNRNRLFILQNIVQNQRDPNVADVRNENRVQGVQLERVIPQPRQPLAADEPHPRRRPPLNNPGGRIDPIQRGNVEPNVLDNDGIHLAHCMARRIREEALRFEGGLVNLAQNRLNNGNAPHNPPDLPQALHHRRRHLPRRAVVNNLGNVELNRHNNGHNGARARQAFLHNAGCAFPHGLDGLPDVANPDPRRAAIRAGDIRVLEVPRIEDARAANPAPARRDNAVNMGIGGRPIRWQPYRRQPLPARDIAGLEEGMALLQERLDRLEDRRFYELMIEGRGQDRIRQMIGTLRQRLQGEIAANVPVNQNVNNARRNPPIVEDNQERPLVMPPPLRTLHTRAPSQTNNQRNPAVKRPNHDENFVKKKCANDERRTAKRPSLDENVPRRSSDSVPPQQNNEHTVAGPSSTRTASRNFPMEVCQNKPTQEIAKGKINIPDVQRDAGPSGSRFESVIKRNTERNDAKNRTNIDGTVINETEGPVNNAQQAENIPQNEENQQNAQEDQNDDVIIVSVYFPVRIKIEREDEDDAQNNQPIQVNAARDPVDPPAPRIRVQVGLENPMPPPYIPVDRNLARNGRPPRPVSERYLNYARVILRNNGRIRGPEFPGTTSFPFLTMEYMVAGLQNFLDTETINYRTNPLPGHAEGNHWDESMLQLTQLYVRLRRELREVISNTERLGIRSHTVSDEGVHVIFVFNLVGPGGTPYVGAEIGVRIKIRTNDGRSDIKVRLNHRIWHPNICPFTGHILPHFLWCNWTIFKTLACVRRLLILPELENTTHGVVARQFRNNHEVYMRTAQHWMCVYGSGYNDHLAIPEYSELLERLVEEGIPKDRALHLLSKNDWDIDRAMEEIS